MTDDTQNRAPLPHPAGDTRLPVTPWQPIPALGAAIAIFAAALLIAWGVTTTIAELVGLQTVTSTPVAAGGANRNDAIYLVFGFMLVSQFALVVLVWLAAGIRRSRPSTVLQLGPPRGGARAIALSFLLMAAGLAVFNVVAYWISPGSILGDLAPFVGMIRSDLWWLVAIVVVIGAPLSEEFLVRGFLLPALAWSPLGFWGAAAVSSFLWSLLHYGYSVTGLVEIFMIGMFFAFVLRQTGSLWAPIALHALNNGLLLVALRVLDLPGVDK